MEKAAILNRGPALQRRAGYLLVRMLVFGSLWFLALAPAWSAMSLAALDDLPVADKYRQLNLILMVSEGIGESFVEQLLPRKPEETTAAKENMPHLEIDDFQTPLNRIVDQRAMITQAAHVFRFALENRVDIQLAMAELAASDPTEVSQVNLIQLAEDAIIIRSALAGSIEYLAGQGDPAMAAHLETYQLRTIYLRNVMEYWKFDQELDAITDDAMKDTGGRMAAYQRMLEDEPNLLGFKQHLQAVERIYRNTRPLKVNPKDLESKDLIEQESATD